MSEAGRVTSKVTVTNISEGPRGLNLPSGTVRLLEVGETAEGIELSAAEQKVAEGTGWFAFGEKAAKKAMAEKEAVQGSGGDAARAAKAAALLEQAPDMDFNNLRAEAREVTGNRSLSNKADIMEALQKAASEG